MAGPTLVDARGVPRFWSTAWAAVDGASLAPTTLQRELSAVDKLYAAIEKRSGRDCLDELLADANLDALEPHLEGYFVELRNRTADGDQSGQEAWRIAIRFVRNTLDRISGASGLSRLNKLDARLRRLDVLYSQIKPARRATTRTLRALPSTVVRDLDDMINPASPRNPFRSEDNAHRNYALYKLMLHQGLRRGEACILPVDALKEGIDPNSGQARFWIDIAENPYETSDTRYTRPSLKTAAATRQIPISLDLVQIVESYTVGHRGRQENSFMFASQKNRPLSLPMVNLVFATLTERLSDEARRDLWDRRRKRTVTPHDLRHTAAVVRLTEFLNAGETMEVALAKLRSFFGWTKDSEMPSAVTRTEDSRVR